MDATEQIIPDAWRDLNATQRDILYILATTGRQTATSINGALGRPHAHPNTVTRNLDGLRAKGYVTSVDADDRPGTGQYHDLTDAGLDVIHDAPVVLEP